MKRRPGLTPLQSPFAFECHMRTRKMQRGVRSTWAPLFDFWQSIDCRRPAAIKSAGPVYRMLRSIMTSSHLA